MVVVVVNLLLVENVMTNCAAAAVCCNICSIVDSSSSSSSLLMTGARQSSVAVSFIRFDVCCCFVVRAREWEWFKKKITIDRCGFPFSSRWWIILLDSAGENEMNRNDEGNCAAHAKGKAEKKQVNTQWVTCLSPSSELCFIPPERKTRTRDDDELMNN